MKNKKVLLIGYGSIGKRHARNLMETGTALCVLTKYPDNLKVKFLKDINEIKNESPNYCIISSPTARHLDDLKRILVLKNIPQKIIIEKPLECSYLRAKEIKNIAECHKLNIMVAYNLRFLEVFDLIKDFVKKQKNKIRIVEIVAGQDLREWRSSMDYSQSYSAYREKGGGVDLDLSHEIDYALWLFGNDFKNKIMHRGKISGLRINSPDVFKLILDYNRFIVDIALDYIRSPKERHIKIICEDGKNLYYDFVSNILNINGERIVLRDKINQSYEKMMAAFLGNNNKNKFCSVEEGLNILKILEV